MGKTYIDTLKYVIYADVKIGGKVEKPDVVGAVFGQTEGLLGDELDLRDLQKNGRIGRIEVNLTAHKGQTTGSIKMPSSLDMVETCILAAALETVDRIGPCEAHLKTTRVEDTRNAKRKLIVDRAKKLLKNMIATELPESKEISELVRDEVKTAGIIEYGPEKIPAGPSIDKSESIVLVEGRADVLNLLKCDVNNVIAVGGASKIKKTIADLTRKKETTVFLDGDRGGDIILSQLLEAADIDFVSRAPKGREVEELSRKEMIKCLRSKVPIEQEKDEIVKEHFSLPKSKPQYNKNYNKKSSRNTRKTKSRSSSKKSKVKTNSSKTPTNNKDTKKITNDKVPKKYIDELKSLEGSLKAKLFDKKDKVIDEIPVRNVIKKLEKEKDVNTVVFDGIVTQRLVDLAESKKIYYLVGLKLGNVFKKSDAVSVHTKS